MRRVQSAVLLWALLIGAATGLAAERYGIDQAHSHVGFSVRFTGLTNVEGKFSQVSGTLVVDEADLTRSSVTAIIRSDSIQTGIADRDTHLKSADFFDAEKFPTIWFRSRRVEKDTAGYRIVGELTMHGVMREVAFPVRFIGRVTDAGGHQRVGFEGSLRIKRTDFGIVGGAWWERTKNLGLEIISDDVDIRLQVQANQWNWDRLEFNSGEKPSIGAHLADLITKQGIEAAVRQYRELKAQRPGDFNFGAEELNLLGRKLLKQNKAREAVEVFKLNVEANPAVGGVYVALADAYQAARQAALAEQNYRKALELDPNNTIAMEMLRPRSPGA